MTRNAQLVILCAACTLLAAVTFTRATAPQLPPPTAAAQAAYASGGATLCDGNPFCVTSRSTSK